MTAAQQQQQHFAPLSVQPGAMHGPLQISNERRLSFALERSLRGMIEAVYGRELPTREEAERIVDGFLEPLRLRGAMYEHECSVKDGYLHVKVPRLPYFGIKLAIGLPVENCDGAGV